MKEYHKIKTLYNRDPENKYKTLLIGQYACLEFEYLKNNTWIFTEKVDGTNIRVMFDGATIYFGGKTDNAQIPAYLINVLNDLFLPQLDLFKSQFSDGVCLYGEGYGAKIQKGGGNYRQDQSFILFDVKIGEWWLERGNVASIAMDLGIDMIPTIGHGTLNDLVTYVQPGFGSQWGNFQAEGIVARPATELTARNGSRIITKLKTRDF